MLGSIGSRDLEAALDATELLSILANPASTNSRLSSMFDPFDLLKPERVDMRVVSHYKDFAQRHHRLAEMHPIRDDLIAGIKLFSCLRIEGVENQVVDWSGAVLGRERVVIDFILGSGKARGALDGLLSGLNRKQNTVRHYRRIGDDHVGRTPLREQRNLIAGSDNLECHDAPVRSRAAPRWERGGAFGRRSPHGHI